MDTVPDDEVAEAQVREDSDAAFAQYQLFKAAESEPVTFFARPFGESELLLVAKAYQDATRHHLEHPRL